MISRYLAQRIIRQRAKFKCEACGSFTVSQYAHIVPDNDGGVYAPSNILFLCYEDHKKYEVAELPLGSRKRKLLIKEMRKLRDKQKSHSPLERFLDFPGDDLRVKVGNNTFKNSSLIFRSQELPEISLLSVTLKDEKLVINGLIFDSNRQLILSIKDNILKTHSNLLFDLIISINNKLQIVSKDRTMQLTFELDNDGILNLSGKVYYYGKRFELSKTKGLVGENVTINNCTFENSNWGIAISPLG